MLNRYQVKRAEKDWDDPGPDLLRTQLNTTTRALESIGPGKGVEARKSRGAGWWPWREVGGRVGVADYLKDTLPTLSKGQYIQLGRDGDPKVGIKARPIVVRDLSNATGAAEQTWALVAAAFPGVKFAGCYLCKRYNGSKDPSVGFSDHAWGDAIDATENLPKVDNDDVTDWVVRMGREGLLAAAQVIGSVNGRVFTFEGPNLAPIPGGPSTHEWHVHISCSQHTGTPPCAR